MKSRINFYQQEFAPQLDLLSLSSVGVAWGALCTLIALVWAGTSWVVADKQEQLSKLEADNQHMQSRVDAMQTELAQRKPDPDLTRQVRALQQTLEHQQRLLSEIDARNIIRQSGFTQLLSDLASQSKSDLWLNTIEVSEHAMLLQGELSDPKAMPQWLNRLADTPSFSGRTFDTARVYRDENGLKFELNAQRQPESAAKRGKP